VGGASWEPSVGARVLLVATGETGTVLRMSSTEWGLLCDIQFDPPSGAEQVTHQARRRVTRRVHASTELRPLPA
jgi:hypothetical protein